MSIRKRIWSDGKQAWQVDLLVKGSRLRKQFPTKGEAAKFELEMRRRAKDGTYAADGSNIRLSDIIPDFIESLRQRLERKQRMTAAHYRAQTGHIANYIIGGIPIVYGKSRRVFEGGLANHTCEELSVEIIEVFVDRLLSFGLAVKTVREVKNTLVGLLELVRRRRYIAINLAKGVRVIAHGGRPRKRKIIPPPKELVRRIIDATDNPVSFQIKFAALTGLRASEQWALRWRSIDLERKYITVETRLEEITKTEGPTKTEAGERDVPISESLANDLKALKTSVAATMDDLVFPSTSGGYRSHACARTSFYRAFSRVMKSWPQEKNRPGKPRWHDLRHFAISCWIEAGLPPKAIQEFAGHTSLQMTMDLYGHLFPSDDHPRAMDRVASALEQRQFDGTQMSQSPL